MRKLRNKSRSKVFKNYTINIVQNRFFEFICYIVSSFFARIIDGGFINNFKKGCQVSKINIAYSLICYFSLLPPVTLFRFYRTFWPGVGLTSAFVLLGMQYPSSFVFPFLHSQQSDSAQYKFSQFPHWSPTWSLPQSRHFPNLHFFSFTFFSQPFIGSSSISMNPHLHLQVPLLTV